MNPATVPARQVRVRGVVTLAYADRSDFAVEDATGGIWATTYDLPPADAARERRSALRAGDEVEVAGEVDRGGYAPRILVSDLVILGHHDLAEPPSADLPRLFSGGDNCRRVAFEGVVWAVRNDGRHDGLLVGVDSRHIFARLPQGVSKDSLAHLIDTTVRIVGVTAADRNNRGEFIRPSLWINSGADITPVAPSPGPPSAAPIFEPTALARFTGHPLPRHRIRTRGTVSAVVSEGVFFLEAPGDPGALRVQVAGLEPLEPGDIVEAAGFLDMRRNVAGLCEAVVERLGKEEPPVPKALTPDDILRINRDATVSGRIAEPGDCDGCLVTFPARVLEAHTTSQRSGFVVLSAGNTVLHAMLDGADATPLAALKPESEVQVKGVIQLQFPDDDGTRSLVSRLSTQRIWLQLTSPADIVVVREPSWWTPTRLAAVLGAVATVLAAVLVWVALLRREVRATTRRLAAEMQSRRNAAVEFQATLRERNRLAANLHDTLLQTLRGIDFQLGACEVRNDTPTDDPREHLAVARRMVNHAAEELRGSVWALRTMPVAGKSFAESLEAIARQTGHGHAEHIAVHSSGTAFEVPQFVAGNLLLVAQEAILNALAHADAGQIDVEADFDATTGTVQLTIVDDGRGFVPGTQLGPDQGHFGLTGMRERIERLGGLFAIHSQPNAGTTVRAAVRKRDYDSRIDVTEADGTSAPSTAV
jgi:signal transduction histidine kinase